MARVIHQPNFMDPISLNLGAKRPARTILYNQNFLTNSNENKEEKETFDIVEGKTSFSAQLLLTFVSF